MKCLIWIGSAALLLSACSASGADQRICEAGIKDSLINPETAEFFDFSPIEDSEFESRFTDYLMNMRGIPIPERHTYRQQFNALAKSATDAMNEANGHFYSVRVKADSRVGLRVTSNYVCGTEAGACTCLSEDG